MTPKESSGTAKPIERVGVLMIHGIGQQARYGHLEPEASQVARALTERATELGLPPPGVRARSHAPALRGATNASWNDGEHAPIVIEVDKRDTMLELHFREVWWADLGDRSGVKSLAHFYAWALGMWFKPEARVKTLDGQDRMRFPERDPPRLSSKLIYRAYLALVGLVVFLPVPLSIVLRILRIDVARFARLLADYLGDVKLYQDPKRVGDVRIEDLGLPPRVSVRARMVHALVEMALSNYDRWYVCAHSLGSVIAFNGLMETEQALPNYLDDLTLARARSGGLLIEAKDGARALSAGEQLRMCPPRPLSLGSHAIIDRNRMFTGLRGLLTYGCPLERFRLLWPAIVPINMEAERDNRPGAFSDMTWINLLDPSDPVASRLTSFDPIPNSKESHPKPINIAYNCRLPHLISHVSYLDLRKGPCAARCLGEWLLNPLSKPDQEALWSTLVMSRGRARLRELVEVIGWFSLLAFGAAVTGAITLLFASQFSAGMTWPAWLELDPFLDSAWSVIKFGGLLMAMSGLVLYLWQKRLERLILLEHGTRPAAGATVELPHGTPPRPAE